MIAKYVLEKFIFYKFLEQRRNKYCIFIAKVYCAKFIIEYVDISKVNICVACFDSSSGSWVNFITLSAVASSA